MRAAESFEVLTSAANVLAARCVEVLSRLFLNVRRITSAAASSATMSLTPSRGDTPTPFGCRSVATLARRSPKPQSLAGLLALHPLRGQ